jgi:membrane dipeptidase
MKESKLMTNKSPQTHAQELHRQAIVIDGHSDILSSLADGRMHLKDRVEVEPPETWQGAKFTKMPPNPTPNKPSPYSMWYMAMGQYDIPRWREGGVTAQVMAMFIEEEHLHRSLERSLDMVATFHREIESNPDTLLHATSAADIRRAKLEDKTALMLSFEGGEPLGKDLNLLEIFYRLGLRMMSLTHSRRNALADGTQLNIQTGGLTYLGRELIQRMNKMGIIVDLSHLSDAGVWEVLELSTAPVIYSHTTVGTMPGYKSALTDIDPVHGTSKLKAVAETGGVAGAIFVAQPDVSSVVDDIETMLQHVGDDHVSIGSDFVSLAHAPKDMQDISKLSRITEELVKRGYADETITKILGGNLLRVFEAVLGD